MTSGFTTGKHIIADIESGEIGASESKSGKAKIMEIMNKKGN